MKAAPPNDADKWALTALRMRAVVSRHFQKTIERVPGLEGYQVVRVTNLAENLRLVTTPYIHLHG